MPERQLPRAAELETSAALEGTAGRAGAVTPTHEGARAVLMAAPARRWSLNQLALGGARGLAGGGPARLLLECYLPISLTAAAITTP